MNEDDELIAEMIGQALEDTYGTTDTDDFVDMAEDETLDDVALANALAEEAALADLEESELAEALVEIFEEQGLDINEEAFEEAFED